MRSTKLPAPGSPAYTRLREDVLSYLWRRYPQHCVVLTDPRSRRAIDVGIARAARHGFRDAVDIRPFVGLMVFLGSHFDEDPQLPWAGEHLRQSARASRADAMTGLLGETARRMEPIVGRSGEYYRRALAWSDARGFEEIAAAHDDSDDGLRGFLRQLYRRKYDALGDDSVERLIQGARSAARQHGLTAGPAVIVYLGLMFLLGSAFDRDPFHPWASEALATAAASGPAPRGCELHERAIETLRRYTRLDRLMQTRTSGG
ncbi:MULTISPECIES: hypothetical protein [Sorangium]|uniref:Uncharacterized protein n=1 Tax=Sorangium cellulosum (strain So ce56) TaxID=448385 RepID=A9F1D3_SORC5|nr:hypothetical protein [Sorangium cellulosum]CAN91354.1 hypothetical protein predicted by Glimmer/Critica [Sorangium cellulosum So ce56]